MLQLTPFDGGNIYSTTSPKYGSLYAKKEGILAIESRKIGGERNFTFYSFSLLRLSFQLIGEEEAHFFKEALLQLDEDCRLSDILTEGTIIRGVQGEGEPLELAAKRLFDSYRRSFFIPAEILSGVQISSTLH